MFSKISISNFKCFKHIKDLKIKPVTILCGTNSSGKSTILQSLLMLKQTFESKNPNQTILLNGPLAHLGTFENLIYGKQLDNSIKFEFCFNLKSNEFNSKHRHTIPMEFILNELTQPITANDTDNNDIEYRIKFEYSLSIAPKQKNEEFISKIIIDYLKYRITVVRNEIEQTPESEITLIHLQDNQYKIYWQNIRTFGGKDENAELLEGSALIKLDFANLSPISFSRVSKRDYRRTRDAFYNIHIFIDLLRNIFSSYTYLGPLREEPARRYIYEDEIIEIGIKGENAAYIYLTKKSDQLKEQYFYDYNNKCFYEKNNVNTLQQALKIWLNVMNIHGFKTNQQNEIIQLNLLSNTSENTEVNIADVGFGVSQIFPIIIEGLRISKGHTLILEQPEIHLHPKLQMQLSDYFISLALSKKNVLVETHSDHIVNRLVRRIVEDNKYNLKDLISIYFIEPSWDGTIFKEIEIDENKGIVNWPKEFFDQTPLEQEKIMQAGLSKRKQVRGNLH